MKNVIGDVTVGELIEALSKLDKDASIVMWDECGCSCGAPGCSDVGLRPNIVYLDPGDPLLLSNYDRRLYVIRSGDQRNVVGHPQPQPEVKPYR